MNKSQTFRLWCLLFVFLLFLSSQEVNAVCDPACPVGAVCDDVNNECEFTSCDSLSCQYLVGGENQPECGSNLDAGCGITLDCGCPNGETCNDGVCGSGGCSNTCIFGERRCGPAEQAVFTCTRDTDADMCTEWSLTRLCSPDQDCVDGRCSVKTCVDECIEGSSRCTSGGVQTCGQSDLDSCLEWRIGFTLCSSGRICQDGVCVVGCSDECTTNICENNAVKICGNFDADACLEFSTNPTACSSVCSDGECIDCVSDDGICDPACSYLNDMDCELPEECTDADNDRYAGIASAIVNGTTVSCGSLDCNDANSNIYPGTTETCNNVDDDCDGIIDDGLTNCACTGDIPSSQIVLSGTCDPSAENPIVCPEYYDCSQTVHDIDLGMLRCVYSLTAYDTSICIGFANAPCMEGFACALVPDGADFGICYTPRLTTETCNDVDDDCDGSVDEGNVCGCPNGQVLCSVTCANVCFGNSACDTNPCDSCTPNAPSCNLPQCSDSIDNDADGIVDYPLDPGCATPLDTDESDSSDHDGDNCADATDAFPSLYSPDSDGDGVHDDCDNCLNIQNADQSDVDYDSVGDVCDTELETCKGTGGVWTDCGSGCGPITCEQPTKPKFCPAVCLPQCVCPKEKPYWDIIQGCIASCTGPACGNGLVEAPEQCDDANTNTYDSCGLLCTTCPFSLQVPCPVGMHHIFPEDLNGDGCGEMICVPNAVCGNGVVESGESCDGTNWGPITGCTAFDSFTSGTLSCTSTCIFNTSACVGPNTGGSCGDTIIQVGEECDGINWGSITGCTNFDSFSGGILACGSDCHFNTNNCLPGAGTCSDSDNGITLSIAGTVIFSPPVGSTRNDACVIRSYTGVGTTVASCTGSSCFQTEWYCTANIPTSIDFSCTDCTGGLCSGGVCNATENVCGDSGNYSCTPRCIGNSACDNNACDGCSDNAPSCGGFCGDSFIQPGEECDTNNTGVILGCTGLDAFTNGILSCTTSCLFNTSLCSNNNTNDTNTNDTTSACGNGVVEPGESCDGNDWGPVTLCTQIGNFLGGNLSCDHATCHFDTAACIAPQCSDGRDNDGDTFVDSNDPECSSSSDDNENPVCGNSIRETAEACDDGNQNNFDSCRNDCTQPSGGGGSGGGGSGGDGTARGDCTKGYHKENDVCVKDETPEEESEEEVVVEKELELSINYDSTIYIEPLSIFTYEVEVTGDEGADDVRVKLDVPGGWEYSGPVDLGNLAAGERKTAIFKVAVGCTEKQRTSFSMSVDSQNRGREEEEIDVTIQAPRFVVKAIPRLEPYASEDIIPICELVFNSKNDRLEDIELEIDVNRAKTTLAVDYVTPFDLDPDETWTRIFNVPAKQVIGQNAITAGFLRRRGKTIATSNNPIPATS